MITETESILCSLGPSSLECLAKEVWIELIWRGFYASSLDWKRAVHVCCWFVCAQIDEPSIPVKEALLGKALTLRQELRRGARIVMPRVAVVGGGGISDVKNLLMCNLWSSD